MLLAIAIVGFLDFSALDERQPIAVASIRREVQDIQERVTQIQSNTKWELIDNRGVKWTHKDKDVLENFVRLRNRPTYTNPVYTNPVYTNPIYTNPIYTSPIYTNPTSCIGGNCNAR
jgi:hypothetical protein